MKVAVVAPSYRNQREAISRGVAILREAGLDVQLGLRVTGAPRYSGPYADISLRLKELLHALRDPSVDVVWCVDGGAGALYLLPLLEKAYAQAPWPHDKRIVGFSDATALLIFFSKIGHPCWYAQNVAVDTGQDEEDLYAAVAAVTRPVATKTLVLAADTVVGGDFAGTLLPGCFSLHASLRGTRFAPSYEDAVLALEEHGPETPGQHEYLFWEKLAPFEVSGLWEGVAAFLWGEVETAGPYAEPEDLFMPVEGLLEASQAYVCDSKQPRITIGSSVRKPTALHCPWGNSNLQYPLPFFVPVTGKVGEGHLSLTWKLPPHWYEPRGCVVVGGLRVDIDYTVVRRTEDLGKIANELDQAEVYALDLETTSLRPQTGRTRLCSLNTGKGLYVIDLFETGTLGPVAQALSTHRGVGIGQNIVFDARFLDAEFNVELQQLFDTWRASVLLHNGRVNMGHDLYVLLRRELNVAPQCMDLGGSDWAGPLTKEQYDYAAEDVHWLPSLRNALRPKLLKAGLAQVAAIEFAAIMPEASVANQGLKLNAEKWTKLAKDNAAKAERLQKELMLEMPLPVDQEMLPGFDPVWNMGSSPQLLKSLHRLGVQVESTDKIQLAMWASKYPQVQKLLEYKKVSRRVSGFGEEYLQHVNRGTGRVHCSYFPMLATGRYAALEPNLSQVPREAEYRACFEAEEGYVYVIVDYSNIEMRLAADISRNAAMIKLFKDGKDAHYYLASLAAKVPESQVTKPQRQAAKPVNFGFVYGMAPPKLVLYAQAGYGVTMSLEEAERIHHVYFNEAYPGLARWHKKLVNEGKRTGISRSAGGRIRHLDPETSYNEFLNTPVQATGADGLKHALRKTFNNLKPFGREARIVHHVHDEIIVECRNHPERIACVEEIVSRSMIEGMQPFVKHVPVVAEPGHGPNWASK